MIIERTLNEFVIRIPITTQVEQMQDLVDYLRYKELTTATNVTQLEVDSLAREINKNWWNKHNATFL